MKKVLFFCIALIFMINGMQAQNSVTKLELVNGKNNVKSEIKSSDHSFLKANPDSKQIKPEFIQQDGKFIRSNPDKPKRYRSLSEQMGVKHDPKPGYKVEIIPQKSSKADVATITFEVVGSPLLEYGIDCGFHMILDADAEMYTYFFDYFWDQWDLLYNMCEYKIPTNASPNLSNPNWLLNDHASIDIPGGVYDFAFLIPYPDGGRLFTCWILVDGWYYESFIDDFTFKAGYEYKFKVDYADEIVFDGGEYDVALKEIILPPMSVDLDMEDISVVLKNSGTQTITGDIALSFIVDGGTPVSENYSANLAPGATVTYTFTNKADLSAGGLHKVTANCNFAQDINAFNDNITGYVKKPFPRTLPFYEKFDTEEDFIANWTVINANCSEDGNEWRYCNWNEDADGGYGSLQINAPADWCYEDVTAKDWLISDPMIITTAGTHNISFWASLFSMEETVKIYYGLTSNTDEMTLLTEVTMHMEDATWPDWFAIYIHNFEIATPGNYYFAFYYCTPIGWNGIDFDNVKIAEGEFVGVPDIVYYVALAPISACHMTADGVIGATVRNRGTEALDQFTLTYQVNGGAVVSQTYNERLEMRESKTVYFNQKVDFSTVGDYNIHFNSSTPDEEKIDNNEFDMAVYHFDPVTTLPFSCDFYNYEDIKNWNPAVPGAWGINDYFGCYYANPDQIPLISRCVDLTPDVYRFSFTFNAGYVIPYTDDFYVAYGKTGTEPSTWTKLKEYKDYITGNGVTIEEDFIIFSVTEPGEYVFGFFPVNYTDLAIFTTVLEVAPEHDFAIRKVESQASFSRLTPKYQIAGTKHFTATLQNKGKTANETGNIKLLSNSTQVATTDFEFTKLGEMKSVMLHPYFPYTSPGNLTLRFNASLNSGVESAKEMVKMVSDSTFAWDNIETGFDYYGGLGLNLPGGLGLIFEVQKEDILTSMTIGFCEYKPAAEKEMVLAVYKVDNDFQLGEQIFNIKYPRTAGDDTKGITFAVPHTTLAPGKYFFEVQQLDGTNIAIAVDDDWDAGVYLNIPSEGYFGEEVTGYGYIHVRPNFGINVGISELQSANQKLTLFPNPVTGVLNVQLDDTNMDKIMIYNVLGKVIHTADVNGSNYRYNTSHLTSGIYFVSVQTKTGIINSKFIVR